MTEMLRTMLRLVLCGVSIRGVVNASFTGGSSVHTLTLHCMLRCALCIALRCVLYVGVLRCALCGAAGEVASAGAGQTR